MDFITIPYEGLLSKAYAAERRKLIDPDQASLEIRPGNPTKFMNRATASSTIRDHATLEGEADHDGDTSYIAVVDKDRNMVSFEPSLHSGWGTGVVMADLGFIFNCRGDYYSLVAGRSQRARARQAAAQHAAEHAGDEGRPAVHDHRQPRRRRSGHADRCRR